MNFGDRGKFRYFVVLKLFGNTVFVGILLDIFAYTVTSNKTARQAIPKFLPTPTNVTVHKGELAELVCHIRDLGPKMVVWRKASDENPLTIGTSTFTSASDISVNHAAISANESKWNLLIKNVQPKHVGVYECQISSTGTYTHYVALNVLSTPVMRKPELTITGTEYVNQYGDIHLICNATGVTRSPDDIDWFFNGNRIHTTHPHWYGRIEILKHRPIPGLSYISELIIHFGTMEDQGNYVCRSSDLNVNSMKVHILNAGKETDIVQRAPVEKTGSMQRAETGLNQGHTQESTCALLVLFTIITYLISS